MKRKSSVIVGALLAFLLGAFNLTTLAQHGEKAGHEAKIELKQPIDGRRRFRGRLEGFEDGEVRIFVDLGDAGEKVIGLGIGLVASARLVLTDELIREALSRAKRKSRTGLGDGSEAGPTDVEDD